MIEKPGGANVQIGGAEQAVAHVSLSENGSYRFQLQVGAATLPTPPRRPL